MSYSIIVATSSNGIIGIDNELPWHLPKDLAYFKKQTTGKTIIMGRKTFESIGKPLPKRENIILTRDMNYEVNGAKVFHSLDNLLEYCSNEHENMVIGGGEIYKIFLPYVDKIYHTLIEDEVQGDTRFFVPNNFKLINEETHDDGTVSGKQNIRYIFKELIKI